MKRPRLFIYFFGGAFIGGFNLAHAEDDTQVWASVTATKSVAQKWDATLEVHSRFTDDVSRLGQVLIRPSVTYKIDSIFSATAGYVYVATNPPGPARIDEHRVWQQIGYVFAQRPVEFSGRTRLEQRFVEGRSDLGWRLRQQFRVAIPLAPSIKVKALLWNETFVGLNDTQWGQRSALDQTRTFIGVAVPLGESVRLEPGYLNQTIFRIGEDRSNNIFAANLFIRF